MDSWTSYPKVHNVGHPQIRDLLLGPVVVQEKVDGSQFSFGVFGGELRCRSKGVQLDVSKPDGMFERAVATARELVPMLHDGWTYRAEYLQKPKHNTLAYDRVPTRFVILFDVATGPESYEPQLCHTEAARLGLESVPELFAGSIAPSYLLEAVDEWLQQQSILGGQLIEGVVIKNHARFAVDGKPLMGKHVSAKFREVHKGDWRERNPTRGDIVERIIAAHRTPARWDKAAQHLRDAGKLTGTPKDIGALMAEVNRDVEEECAAEIQALLWDHYRKDILRGVGRGLPEWYKQRLLEVQAGAT